MAGVGGEGGGSKCIFLCVSNYYPSVASIQAAPLRLLAALDHIEVCLVFAKGLAATPRTAVHQQSALPTISTWLWHSIPTTQMTRLMCLHFLASICIMLPRITAVHSLPLTSSRKILEDARLHTYGNDSRQRTIPCVRNFIDLLSSFRRFSHYRLHTDTSSCSRLVMLLQL
ncbi:predicted protein [Plenodomus lingam JN3]|uniref:Uncharacterized protein n=1 Tax=Leptosphaeria maculans (strain JN3 / isolate v23.1.3 / race Av1-4-5-6-7-8) TaxID=985895 RepID=E4ZGW8_LEPMJ|nr:predicted protein [Plenodomus lingam JN3]CBX90538.1 predicted protein [Plenodomus lingam JN3]